MLFISTRPKQNSTHQAMSSQHVSPPPAALLKSQTSVLPPHSVFYQYQAQHPRCVALLILYFRTESLNSNIRIRIIEDTCPPPAGNLPQDARKRAEAAAAAAPVSGRREKRFYICRELQVGAAVGAGGTVLAAACGRRPIRYETPPPGRPPHSAIPGTRDDCGLAPG